MRKVFFITLVLFVMFVSGSAGADNAVYCVGDNGTILKLENDGWHTVSTSLSGHSQIWGSSGDNIYACGGGISLSHFNGTEWEEIDLSSVLPMVNLGLRGVHGSSPDNIIAVGSIGYTHSYGIALCKFNGESWSQVPISSGDCYSQRCFLHPNSSAFLLVEKWAAPLTPYQPALIQTSTSGGWTDLGGGPFDPPKENGDICMIGDDVYLVQSGYCPVTPPGSAVRKYSPASGWSYLRDESSPYMIENRIFIGDKYFFGIWGTSSADIWLAGDNGKIAHYDGSTYEVTDSGTDEKLNAMWGTSNDCIFAVGGNGTIVHYDGTNWSQMESGTTENLQDIWGIGGVVAALLRDWRVERLDNAVKLSWELSEYDKQSLFRITRTPVSSKGTSVSFTKQDVTRKDLSFEFIDRNTEPGHSYTYSVEYIKEGKTNLLFESAVSIPPCDLAIISNYPNPFNPTTTISYMTPSKGNVKLLVYDISGRLVRSVFDGELEAGSHVISWNGIDNSGRQVTSGIYFCRLICNKQSTSKKLILLR